MLSILENELLFLWYYSEVQIRQLFGFWALGILIGSFVAVFLKNKIHQTMAKLNSHISWFLGLIFSSLLGLVSPLCMYGTIPIVAALSRTNVKQEWIASFMMSSVLLNPQLFIFSLYLGTDVAIIRLLACLFVGVLAGVLCRVFFKEKEFFTFTKFSGGHNHDTDPNLLIRYLKNVYRNLKVTLPYFLIGILLTSLYQRYIPSENIIEFFREYKELGAFITASIGVPLYLCGGGTIPLIDAMLNSGVSVGSAVAFMLSGAATKLTNLGAMKIVLGAKNFLIYILFCVISAVFTGITIDLIL